MPRRDGSGPNGQGSKTGRGLGNCDQVVANPNQENENLNGRGLSKNSGNAGRRKASGFGNKNTK